MRKAEERLRDLHPYAMARYDRLRGDGIGPAEAMREAAPLFARPARAHDAPYTPRPVLTRAAARPLDLGRSRATRQSPVTPTARL